MDRTNDRTSRGQYSMRFKLIHKQSKEVVDTVDVIKTSEQIATELFRQKKQLDDKTFKRLYEVKADDGNRLTRL